MSFFGFESRPRDQAPGSGKGFFETPDPFANVKRSRVLEGFGQGDDDDALDFEDTYDGLADQLDETNDDLNDDTFGGDIETGDAGKGAVGKDFDFFGQTAKVSDVINEEQVRYSLQHPQPTSLDPAPVAQEKAKRSGYEKYQDPGYIPEIQANASLWGQKRSSAPRQSTPTQSYGTSDETTPATSSVAFARKYLSLEEVEAQMRSQRQSLAPQYVPPPQNQPAWMPPVQTQQQPPPVSMSHHRFPSHVQELPHPQAVEQHHGERDRQPARPSRGNQAPQILQRQAQVAVPPPPHRASPQPLQILQNPNRMQTPQGQPGVMPGQPLNPAVPSDPTQQPQIITHPQQLMHVSEEQRQAFLLEDAKRAKRNHKIYLLSKGNGLMTPQDKNFITRIQLQQLVTATGNVNDPNPEAALNEDFYYQVYSQIRGAPRQHPHQPLGHFAQTYLFQTGGRSGGGGGGRRQYQNGENHMQRMQQQVQRAVEAAKAKPKNKQLIIEGSLGKISFSNAKTPKPLLNIHRPESGTGHRATSSRKVQQPEVTSRDKKSILKTIEEVYTVLMRMEDVDRQTHPLPANPEAELVQRHADLNQRRQLLNEKLWDELKVMEPIVPGSNVPHPFIVFLSFPKGMKAIPRIFRHINQEQRVTILTLILVHLDVLDVVRHAQLQPGEAQLPLIVREEVEMFAQTVMPSLFGYVNEAPMNIVLGLTGLVLGQTHVKGLALTKIGLLVLTMLLSRAELVKEANSADERDLEQWDPLYNRLFDILEPVLGNIFPESINSGDDMYVWQFLAAMGVGASPEQQQRLVIAVKDRVMDTVAQSKTLPVEMSSQKLSNVNLFMRSIGLDVELLG